MLIRLPASLKASLKRRKPAFVWIHVDRLLHGERLLWLRNSEFLATFRRVNVRCHARDDCKRLHCEAYRAMSECAFQSCSPESKRVKDFESVGNTMAICRSLGTPTQRLVDLTWCTSYDLQEVYTTNRKKLMPPLCGPVRVRWARSSPGILRHPSPGQVAHQLPASCKNEFTVWWPSVTCKLVNPVELNRVTEQTSQLATNSYRR